MHGERVIGKVKVDDAVLGMRGLPVMFYDGSSLDPISGITFRGHSIPEFCERSQKAPGGSEPLPEAMFFLLLTGRYPTDEELKLLLVNWQHRGVLPKADTAFILSLPREFHPMTMLSMSLLHQQTHSKFFKAYQAGINKARYWEYYFEDSMDLLARLPHICATIYRHKYHNSKLIEPDHNLDWAGNFGHMLGFQDFQMKECLRGYISIHADHEGGNVSAHTSQLVGSALADPYLSFSAAINGLAGPLHGLANQECLKWLTELKDYHKGAAPSKQIIEEYVRKTLGEGKVIPGYGHAVLRNTDPRFLHLKSFADRNIKDDYICDLARQCFDTIPDILKTVGKIKNPWPNVDAFSGALLQHYGTIFLTKVSSSMNSTQLCLEFRVLWGAFPTAFGPEPLDCRLSDPTASTLPT
jgi:citrate synthase